MRGGKYPNLIITRKRKRNRKYYVPETIAKFLKR